jgi:uncharacterized LabA/DUF88 family protein
MPEKVAILIDGAFLSIKLKIKFKRYTKAKDILDHCSSLLLSDYLKSSKLFRIYYYDALPFEKALTNPIDGTKLILANKDFVRLGKKLIQTLELKPNFAIRKGITVNRGWKLGSKVLEAFCRGKKELDPDDIMPDIQQKTVDLKIGLDIAWLSVKRIVDIILLITGDSDFVPAMKFARKEGIKVYLNTLNHPVNRELIVHSDLRIEI